MISLGDMRPAWRRPAGAQQRRLPLWHKRLAEIIDLAKNLDDPIQHHRLRYSAMAAYLKKLFRHNPLVARKPLIRVQYSQDHIWRPSVHAAVRESVSCLERPRQLRTGRVLRKSGRWPWRGRRDWASSPLCPAD